MYVGPPRRAEVLSFDEKSQIPALNRTQPGLPPPERSVFMGTLLQDVRDAGCVVRERARVRSHRGARENGAPYRHSRTPALLARFAVRTS